MKKAIALILLLCLFTGCGPHSVRQSKTVYAMDTVMTLTVYGDESVRRGAHTLPEYALVQAEEEILRLEELLSVSQENSDIAQLNREGVLDNSVGPDAAQLICRALELAELSSGDFDPTIYPLTALWGFSTKEFHVPTQAELDALLPVVDYKQITQQNGRISMPRGMGLDLGGIAKGYTAERALDVIAETGIESAIISLGGNVGALSLKPDGSPWTVAIRDPAQEGSYIATLSLGGAYDRIYAITSGGYERYFEENGKTYHHILDPKTGTPAETDLLSVTIVSQDGTLADALSTALFVKGFDEAVRFWRANPGEFGMVLVTEDGLFATAGLDISSENPISTLEVTP